MSRRDVTNKLYKKADYKRSVESGEKPTPETYRSSFRRDYARILHCPAFRRLQGKTQLFPGHESDFFRNRLTHSLEVAQIAKSVATAVNQREPFFRTNPIDVDLVELASLAHDLGHPPFGHNGEEALDECMIDAGGFEGNAQSLRILARLEKKTTHSDDTYSPVQNGIDNRAGLGLTYRSLASILKYDRQIPQSQNERQTNSSGPIKGYYYTERDIVGAIKKKIPHTESKPFKTIECSIMDIADDIAYSTYDLEDALKAKFLTPSSILSVSDEVISAVCETITRRAREKYQDFVPPAYTFTEENFHEELLAVFAQFVVVPEELEVDGADDDHLRGLIAYAVSRSSEFSDIIARNGYFRTDFTSDLVGVAIDGTEIFVDPDFPAMSTVRLEFNTFLRVEVLKNIVYQSLIMSPMLKVTEYRGKKIVRQIFDAIIEKDGHLLMPSDFQSLYCDLEDAREKRRVVCDFIAGMTDRYAMQFYNRLFGSTAETIYSPI